MPPRKRASQASASRRQAPPSSEERYNEEEEEEEEVAHETMREGLRKFVEEFKGKTHRVVEMRIALACAFGVAMRLLFAEKLTEEVDDMVVYSGFIFTGGEGGHVVEAGGKVQVLFPSSVFCGADIHDVVGLLPHPSLRLHASVRTHILVLPIWMV